MKMKFNQLPWLNRDEGETIAVFGDARLVKKLSGKLELLGGSPDDRRAAREWCSMFLHEAAVACALVNRSPAPTHGELLSECGGRDDTAAIRAKMNCGCGSLAG